jgi:hypothetical protein
MPSELICRRGEYADGGAQFQVCRESDARRVREVRHKRPELATVLLSAKSISPLSFD